MLPSRGAVRVATSVVLVGTVVAAAAFTSRRSHATPGASELILEARGWRIIPRESGKVDYYRVIEENGRAFIRAEYKPSYKTAVLGFALGEADRQRARTLRWSWRAMKLPEGGDECASGKQDSAAVIYVTWKRGLRYYTLKYVWSGVGTKGAICDRKRNPFVAQDTIIVDSGGPLGVWRNANIDLRSEFRNHFEDGDANAAGPDLLGVGIMTDGDQTSSESAADYGNFAVGF